MYELARKHCGAQSSWKISLDLLQKKCGSNSTPREFKRLVQNIVKQDANHEHMPDYSVTFDGEHVIFSNRSGLGQKAKIPQGSLIFLQPETREKARQAAPSWDIDYLEQEWRSWMSYD